MLLTIKRDSKISIFRQIFDQIKALIENGSIKAGEHLPSTRELAKVIGVNRSTIIRVYDELLIHGYVESTPGSYTMVRKKLPVMPMRAVADDAVSEMKNIFKDDLGLQYDLMMHYLENGKQIESGKINFLQLSPDVRLLNSSHVNSCMKDTLNETNPNPFEFTHARGYPPLRQEIVKQMRLHSIQADDENVLVTNGSLQSLQLIFQVFSHPGDYIVVEKPSYSIMHMFTKIYKLNVIEVPVTNEGMDLEILANELQKNNVKFVYVMPAYQNPTGISMPRNKREEFLNICLKYDCIIIEDSIEEEMCYSGNAYAPVKSIDQKGQVIYLGTYSKIMAPGLRIGWIVASNECIKKLTVLKSIFEISSGSVNQIFLYNFIKKGAFDLHLRKMIRVFKRRMKVAIAAVKRYLPQDKIEWTEPGGGYMIWIKLLTEKRENIEYLFSKYGVMIHNGQYFFMKQQPNDYIRICIAQTNEEEIEEGIKKIGEAIKSIT